MTKFSKILKRAWFMIKTFVKGFVTTLIAAIGLANVPVALHVITEMNTVTGWSAILRFFLLIFYFIVFILTTYFIGTLVNDSNELYEYKCQCEVHNKDSSKNYEAADHRSDSEKISTSNNNNKTSTKK